MNEEERTVASRRFAERLREMDSKRLSPKQNTFDLVLKVIQLICFLLVLWVSLFLM